MFLREKMFCHGKMSRGDLNLEFQLDVLLDSLSSSVSDYERQSDRGSKPIQDSILHSLEKWGVDTQFKFQPVGEKGQANFELDFLRTFNGTKGRAFLGGELAFDNRQAIFTNVVKVDLALQRLREASESSVAMSVLVTFCQNSRTLGNWDSSVATFEEYSKQLEWGLERYLTSPFLLIGLEHDEGPNLESD